MYNPEIGQYFIAQSQRKGFNTLPQDNLPEFTKGIASFQGVDPNLDQIAPFLVNNYEKDCLVDNVVVSSLLGRQEWNEKIREQSDKAPIIFVAPHPSLATPYLLARAIHGGEFDEDFASRVHIVAGPRPMTIAYKLFSDVSISPYQIGVGLGNLLLTGPNTGSLDDAPEKVQDFLKVARRQFKENLLELTEPKNQGENNIIIVCPAGRIAKSNPDKHRATEYRARSHRFWAEVGEKALFWPVGFYDELLVDPKQPASPVGIHPDEGARTATKTREVAGIHRRAVELSHFEIGKMIMETNPQNTIRRGKDFVAKFTN